MDWLLIAVTLGSLVLAIGASVVAWRASRDEKHRAAARVAALAAAAGLPLTSQPQQVPAWPDSPPARDGDSFKFRQPVHVGSAAEPARTLDVAEQERSSGVTLTNAFLSSGEPARDTSGRQRLLAAAAVIVAVLLGGLFISRTGGSASPSNQATVAPTPLELLSLGHQREGTNLAITGLVRNPPTSTSVQRVSAIVFLFDQQGTFVTSGKAPLDYVSLGAGDESPFVIKVQAPQSVARYRVSFRNEEATVPHVDRRGEPNVTAPVALTRQ
jgi:hypothetical protein